ncbi:unnamed protein product [Brassica oleracea var. botrytis]|uniref:(rape) hypothetical protein n=1 Tax=Brassica napus TaxID=3708 RepID=A0A816RWN8_BRANA|nr:unnamed protein product [Brassica napus]
MKIIPENDSNYRYKLRLRDSGEGTQYSSAAERRRPKKLYFICVVCVPHICVHEHIG